MYSCWWKHGRSLPCRESHCRTETFDKLQILKAEYCDSVTADKFYD